jgi:hypothetical protein
MGLDEHPVDLFEVHDARLITDGFNERAETEVAGAAQQAFAGTNDEGDRRLRQTARCNRLAAGNSLRRFI